MELSLENVSESLETTSVSTRKLTHLYSHSEGGELREGIVNTIYGILGVLCFFYNAMLVGLYVKQRSLRKHISYMMLHMFLFCMIQGLVNCTIHIPSRIYRFEMNEWVCVITTLIVAFFDYYILLLLPLLAIDRFLSIKHPFLSKRKTKIWVSCSSVAIIIITIILSDIPLGEFARIFHAQEPNITSPEAAREQAIITRAVTCNHRLNKASKLQPMTYFFCSTFCVLIVMGLYLSMYCIAKQSSNSFRSMTLNKQKRLKRTAISVVIVIVTYCVTFIPNGTAFHVNNLCFLGLIDTETCIRYRIVILADVAAILACAANFIAPLLWTMLNPQIRIVVWDNVMGGTTTIFSSSLEGSSSGKVSKNYSYGKDLSANQPSTSGASALSDNSVSGL